MADPWCGKCGKNLMNQLFCTNCGNKASSKEEDDSGNKSEVMNYSFFKTKKASERRVGVAKKITTRQKKLQQQSSSSSTSATEEVQINVGIIEENKNETLTKRRGSRIPVTVYKGDGREEVLAKSLKKLGEHDQFFCRYDTYQLCYPDCSMAFRIPGSSNIPFTVEGYKLKLGKPYSKIELFVCLAVSLLEQPIDSDPDLDKKSTLNGLKMDEEAGPSFSKEVISVSDEDDDKTKTIADERPNKSRVGSCPVCSQSQSIPIDDLQQHANDCLNKSPLMELQGHLQAPEDLVDHTQTMFEKDLDGKITFEPRNQSDYIREIQKALVKCVLIENPTIDLFVRRGFEFDDFARYFNKSWNKKEIGHIIKINYLGIEVGVDDGGVSREFYSEAFSQVMQRCFRPVDPNNQQLGFEPALRYVSATDGTLEAIGHLFVASLVHNGPGPNFFAPWVFQYISGGLENVILPEDIGDSLYKKIYHAKTDEEMMSLVESDEGYDMLEAIGYSGSTRTIGILSQPKILRSIFMKEKSGMLNILNDLSRGMQYYNALAVIRDHVTLFGPCFTPSNLLSWEFDIISTMLFPQYDETDGSNKRFLEINTYKSFLDFIALSFKDENCELPSPILMKFLTGCETVPPLGIPTKQFKVYFKHECQPSDEGKPCACLPQVSTCAFWVKLPIHISDEDNMCQSFVKAVKEGVGFQLA